MPPERGGGALRGATVSSGRVVVSRETGAGSSAGAASAMEAAPRASASGLWEKRSTQVAELHPSPGGGMASRGPDGHSGQACCPILQQGGKPLSGALFQPASCIWQAGGQGRPSGHCHDAPEAVAIITKATASSAPSHLRLCRTSALMCFYYTLRPTESVASP